MHASSNPVTLVSTKRVNKRRNTAVPAMSVNARAMLVTRVPAGVDPWLSILATQHELKLRESLIDKTK